MAGLSALGLLVSIKVQGFTRVKIGLLVILAVSGLAFLFLSGWPSGGWFNL